MDPRPYQPCDRDACLALADAPTPEFAAFLGNPANCTVLEHDGRVVGCGGFLISGNSAILIHGVIHRDFRRMGLGRFLLLYRLRQISQSAEFARVSCPPQFAPFYEKQGFRSQTDCRTGQTLVELVMKLKVCP